MHALPALTHYTCVPRYFYRDGIAFKDSVTGEMASAATKVRRWCWC